jgi:hypothetical protein
MQASTAGDQYNWALTESDGLTPFPLVNATTAHVAIAGPYPSQSAAWAATFTSGLANTELATLTSSPPMASWVTTIAGNSGAQRTTYPTGGFYVHQILITYSTGAIAKSNLFVIEISDSIA